MKLRKTIIAAAIIAVSSTAGCSIVKKAAKGQSIDRDDVVNEADSQYKDHERDQEKADRLVKRIDQTLESIKEYRSEGRFGTAEYREKALGRYLDDLKEVDSDHDKLTSAPKELAKIKEKYTRDVYERKALTAECKELIDEAKEARMEERWRYVDRNLSGYVKCRRKLIDAGGDESEIAAQDELYIEEFGKFAAYSLEQIETRRKDSDFRVAVGFEKNLEQHVDDYKEIADEDGPAVKVAKKMEKIRMTYRDPREVEAEKAEEAFVAWKKSATKAFEKEMAKIKAAEEKAQPAYDAGVAALEKGEYKKALSKLTEARSTLYAEAYPSSVALDSAIANGSLKRGLSYKIAAAIARVHFEQGNIAKLYPELNIIREGRVWLDKEDELKVRLYDILADRDGNLAPKASDPVKRYASRFSDTARKYRFTKEAAEAKVGEAYAMLGVDLAPVSHRRAASNPGEHSGKVVYVEEPVTKVSGGKLHFDFRSAYNVPTKCWHTNRVASVNAYTGEVRYEQKCKYKKVKRGYILEAPVPKGVKVRKGDKVAFYATVGKKEGKHTLNLQEPGYVRVAPNGKTAWYLGVDVKK